MWAATITLLACCSTTCASHVSLLQNIRVFKCRGCSEPTTTNKELWKTSPDRVMADATSKSLLERVVSPKSCVRMRIQQSSPVASPDSLGRPSACLILNEPGLTFLRRVSRGARAVARRARRGGKRGEGRSLTERAGMLRTAALLNQRLALSCRRATASCAFTAKANRPSFSPQTKHFTTMAAASVGTGPYKANWNHSMCVS